MIGAVGSAPGLLPLLAEDSARVQDQLAAALQQQGTGKVAQSFAGLGADARTTLDLRPQLQHVQVWQDNIDRASARLDATQTALKSISAIATDLYAKVGAVGDLNSNDIQTLSTDARKALQQVAQLLNTRSGDTYVFAGQDTANPPVPDTDPAVVGAALLASDTAAPPFSATLGTAVPQVEVGDGQVVPVGLLANQNTLAASAAPTTGSYMRDVMRALATVAAATAGPGTVALMADTRARLQSAIGAMADETGALGDVEADLQTRKSALASTQATLTQQVSDVEDVDMAATISRVSALQTQLQASYQTIAGVKDLSLAKVL